MKIKRKGYTLCIYDEEMESPRDFYSDTNIGKMVCFHRRYNLGDKHDFKNPSEVEEWFNVNKDEIAFIMPLYLLDHSGLVMSTHDFCDPWDSGQVGYIYCTKENLKKHGYDETTTKEELESLLNLEVQQYSDWLMGIPQCYGFYITDENDDTIYNQGIYADDDLEHLLAKMKNDVDKEYHFLFDAMLEKENKNDFYL